MKKCGARTIDDTYIQLAHALNSTHTMTFKDRQSSNNPSSSISSSAVLQLVEYLSVDLWTLHRGTWVFPIIISKALLARQQQFSPSDKDEVREKLVEAGRTVWKLIDPFTQETRMEEMNKEGALTHYLLILCMSSKLTEEVMEEMKTLLPRLVQFQTKEARYSAM